MTQPKRHHLFISHAWDYNDDYHRLVNMLRQAQDFEWYNYSVPEHDPKEANNKPALREALRKQMQPTNCVLIISGMYVTRREWIQYEINVAKEWNKPIIGIKPRGHEMMPTAVTSVAKEIVGWYTPSIVEAIERQAGSPCHYQRCGKTVTRQDSFCPHCFGDIK